MSKRNSVPSQLDPLVILKQKLEADPKQFYLRTKQLFKLSENLHDRIKRFADLILKGYTPVIYSNHQSHTDGIILTIVIEEIRKLLPSDNLKGFLCPVAASMSSGDQNSRVQAGTFLFEPIFNQMGFFYVPIIREDDRRKYGMEGSNVEAIEKLMHAPRDNFGLIVFPEGTVQGGRKDAKGNIFGMQAVDNGGILMRCISFWQSQGKKSVLLPVGIINSYNIFDPDSYELPEKLLDMIGGKSEAKQIVDVTAGEPITIEELENQLGSTVDPKNQEHIDLLMRNIAKLLPLEAQGYYKLPNS